MKFVMYGRTTFVIAHRISTVKEADVVIVLENGRITQMGTHEELLAQGGHYREIADVQLYGDGDATQRILDREQLPSHMDRVRDYRPRAAAHSGPDDRREPSDNTRGDE